MTPSLKLNMMRDQAQRNISLSANYADYVKHHAVLCMVLSVARTTHTSPVDHAMLDELQHEIDMYLAEAQKRHAWKTGADMQQAKSTTKQRIGIPKTLPSRVRRGH